MEVLILLEKDGKQSWNGIMPLLRTEGKQYRKIYKDEQHRK